MTLARVSDGPAVVACSTCRHSAVERDGPGGVRGGAALVAALRAAQAADPAFADIAIEEMPCLFACSDFCTVHIRAPGKIGYVLGRFAPGADAARAILDYARLHADSAEGQVAYRDWPEGVKGHFLVRVPPAGYVTA